MNLIAWLAAPAAGVISVAAWAADDPIATPTRTVEYVRVCSVHGDGFFQVPGMDSCLRISGYARADMRYVNPVDRVQDSIGFRGRGRLNLDSRTSTPYGTLRAYVRFEAERSSGAFNDQFSQDEEDVGTPIGGGIEEEFELDVAYIQFAGFTAGLVQSFFDFYTNELNFEDVRTSDEKVTLFAYTTTLSEGFTATLSLENAVERRFAGAPFGGFPFPIPPESAAAPGVGTLEYAGMRVPDVVGNVRLEREWGDLQLSGVVHEVRAVNVRPAAFGGGVTDTRYGFALQAGAKFNLPFLAEDDELWMQAAYGQGAVGYLGMGDITQIGGALVSGVDGFVDPAGDIRLSRGFSLVSALLHHWTPQVKQAVFGSYARLDYPGIGQGSVVDPLLGPVNIGFVDFDEWRVGSNLIWSPVEDLELGVELLYTKLDPKGSMRSAPIFRGPEGFEQRRIDSDDVWIGRVRLNRDF